MAPWAHNHDAVTAGLGYILVASFRCTTGQIWASRAMPYGRLVQSSPEFPLRIWLGKPTLGYAHQLKQQ